MFEIYRQARAARRALVLLLLADGWSYRQIGKAAFASPTLIARGEAGLRNGRRGRARWDNPPRRSWSRIGCVTVVRWLLSFTPQDFGFFRSRWSCELLAMLLREQEGIRLSPETVRRGLHRMEFVWRRPRPVVGPRDPEHAAKLRKIRRLMAHLPADETVVFQDEVDVHLNPKIGSCWMVRGQQAEVATPGNNDKRHLAGSLHWRTGRLLLSSPGHTAQRPTLPGPPGRPARQLAVYRVIHVVCDNAKFHNCRAVQAFLAAVGTSHHAPLPAEVRSRDQPHRTHLVASARDDHPQPPLPHDRRTARPSLRMDRHPRHLLSPNLLLPKHLPTGRLALRSVVGPI